MFYRIDFANRIVKNKQIIPNLYIVYFFPFLLFDVVVLFAKLLVAFTMKVM